MTNGQNFIKNQGDTNLNYSEKSLYPTRMPKTKRTDNTKCWQECGKTETLNYNIAGKNPAMPPLDIYPT